MAKAENLATEAMVAISAQLRQDWPKQLDIVNSVDLPLSRLVQYANLEVRYPLLYTALYCIWQVMKGTASDTQDEQLLDRFAGFRACTLLSSRV